MADEIRCPMCSKNNPAGAETCQHCGARLTLLGSSSPTGSADDSAGADPADWLKGLRVDSTDDADALPGWQGTAAGDDIPDWLADVRGISQSASEGDSADQASAGGLPDWMSADSATNPSEKPAETPGMQDWLSSLREPEDVPETPSPADPAAQEESAQQGTPGEDDWLSKLQPWSTLAEPEQDMPASAEQPPAMGGEDDLSAWLKSLDNHDSASAPLDDAVAAEAPAQPADSSKADLSWVDPLSPPAGEPPAVEKERSLEEWLSEDLGGADQPAESQPSASPATPDWLASSFSTDQPAANTNAPAASAGEALPDWLSGFISEDEPESSAQPVSDEIPSWLAETTQAQPDDLGQAEPAVAADLPDWMAGVAPAAVPEQPLIPEETPSVPDAVPSWLQAATPDAESETLPAAALAAAQPDFEAMFAEEPDEESKEGPWMENIQAQIPPQPVKQPEPPASPESAPVAEPSEPDWLAAFASAGTSPSEPASSESVETPFIDPQQPAWLNDLGQNAQPALPAGAPALFEEQPQPQPDLEMGAPFKVDLPDWLDKQSQTDLEADAEGAEEAEELAPAELPGWVQEMRPLESIIPGQEIMNTADQQRIEKAGPLAGMRGVLQSEEPAAHFRKLPAYSSKLKVSERQHLHAGLLQNVLDGEMQPSTIPAEASGAPQTIYRLVIAVVMTLALLVGLVFKDFGLFAAPLPTASEKGVLDLFKEIESIPPGAPVLVAFDYEAALSGEMRYAASSVLEHLMARNVKLIVVSTVPAGPVLANDLLLSVQQGQPSYDLAATAINLGYLPGGATSLLEFAQRPQVAAPVDQNGNLAWSNPILQGVRTIQDFKMVLVLTDSVETGRAWVEQVQPVLGSIPLTMVASAQAGPLLLPYFDASQIKGLVNGLMGGAMYEQHYGKANLASKDWNAYQLGYSAGILLLILGGVFSALRRVAKKPRKARV